MQKQKLRYLPLEPRFWDVLEYERETIKGLGLWVVAMASLISLLTPAEPAPGWLDYSTSICASETRCSDTEEDLIALRVQDLATQQTMLAP